MIDFNKKYLNSNKFRQAAITFIQTGRYCSYPQGTSEYFKYWDEEQDRCINGYTADDGDFISGYNYFYLNYCPISRIVNHVITNPDGSTTVKRKNEVTFPDFWDYDAYYFNAVQEAEDEGKHLCVLKARRRGFSYKGASMLCRNYYLIPNSKSFVYAANKQYLTDDGILTKAWDYMDFIDKNTAWGKKRSVNTQMRKRAGFFVKDDYGNQVELGYKSEIIGVTLKDNPSVIRGKKASLILFEEGGSMPELAAAWQIARPSVEVDGIAFAPMIVWGTAGDKDSNFATLKDMFYNPEGYNCIGFDNIWEESLTTTKCGFFCPQYSNMDIRDKQGNRLYMDIDGNTFRKKSIEYVLAERKKVVENATNSTAVDRYICERPIMPSEAMLQFNGNIFPKKELQDQLAYIRTHESVRNMKQVGDLVWQPDGSLRWDIKKHGDITHYPLQKDEDTTGSIVIWEHPNKEASFGQYIAGIDSYDYDSSSTTSLGSCFIYKRFQTIEEYSDMIVAEYTGRPETAEEFYENVRKLLIYYDARAMYENQNKGIYAYFVNKHCDYLLADQPKIINDVIPDSKVQRKKGCHMNKQLKTWGEGLIKEWLLEEDINGRKNLTKIYSEPLLEELISYNDEGNFDRCLTKNTLITTDTGFKKVQDIKVGDKVVTHNGNIKQVTWVDSHKHNGSKVKLRLIGDYRVLECTDNHPIYVAYTSKKTHKYRKDSIKNKAFLRADQLTYKYQFGLLPKRKGLKNIDLSDDVLYLLGWIMSDGYVDPSNGIRITYQIDQLNCAKKCLQIIEDYLKDEKYYFSINNTKRIFRKPTRIFRYNNCWRLEVHSKKLHELAKWFGCNANNKKINPEIFNNYGNLMPFILGWLEGDGHQRYELNYDGSTRNGIELATIYEELIHQCRQIMIDHGIYSSIRKVKLSKYRNAKQQYSILLSNEYAEKVLNYYHSLKFKRFNIKKNTSKVLEDSDGFWVPIKLLELSNVSDTVYNFEVEDDHTYIANGIVTHNCMSTIQLMIYRQELFNVIVKKKSEDNKKRLLFDGPIFTQEWFRDDETDLQTYMF